MSNTYRKWIALIGLSLASFLTAIDFAIVNTALPAIKIELAASMAQLQWMMNIYVLVVCVLLVTAGRIADIVGRRSMIYAGIIIFGVTSLFCALATTPLFLIIGRALQGIGSAIIIPCSLSLVSDVFNEHEQAKALGIWTSINGIGFALGPVLGGLFVSLLSWRWVFYINIPFVIISIFLCAITLKPAKAAPKTEKIDWLGFILFTLGIGCLITNIIQVPAWGLWHLPISKILWLTAAVSLLIFYYVEKKNSCPIFKFSLFTNRTFMGGVIANFAVVMFSYVAFFFLPLYLDSIRGETADQLGLMLLSITATLTIFSPIAGRLVNKVGGRALMLFGLFLLIISALLQSLFNQHTQVLVILLAFIIYGLAWAAIWGSATHLAISAVPKKDSGLAAGTLWTLQNFGGALGLAITGMLFRFQSNFLTGFAQVFWFLAAISLLSLISVWVLSRRT